MTIERTATAVRTMPGGAPHFACGATEPGSPDSSGQLSTLRVVQVHSADVGGGAEATARLHHEELLRQGHPSRLLVAQQKSAVDGIEPIEFVRGPKGLLRSARWLERQTGIQYPYSPSFRRLMRRLPEECDVVHLHSLHGAEGYADISCIARLSRRVPVALTVHDMWLVTGHCGHPLECERWQTGCGRCPDLQRYPAVSRDATRINWWRKKLAFRSARIHLIAPSRWIGEQLRQSPILGHLPQTVVHSPVQTSCFTPRSRELARTALGLPHDRKIVLVIAQYLSNIYKGLPEGIRALNLINDPNLFVVAIGHDAAAVLGQCHASGRAVRYHDDQSALAEYYRAADVLLMPSRRETFGMVAMESMACGTPVVAFAAGGLADALGNNEGGLLVPPGDVEQLAAALRQILDDPELQVRLGRIGAERAAQDFSLAAHSQRCLDVYHRLLAERQPNN